MKKVLLTSFALCALVFFSCDTMTDVEGLKAKQTARIDSLVNVELNELRTTLTEDCDAAVAEAVEYRVDSLMAAAAGKKITAKKPKKPSSSSSGKTTTTTTTTTTVTPPPAPAPTPTPPPSGGQKDRGGATNVDKMDATQQKERGGALKKIFKNGEKKVDAATQKRRGGATKKD